jgi:hypothetical protein
VRERLQRAVELYEASAAELDLAARHCRVAADHFRTGEVPRGAAHAFAAHGHALRGRETLDEAARLHAAASRVPEAR